MWCVANGGAMHLAAALGKPILCFFGDFAARALAALEYAARNCCSR